MKKSYRLVTIIVVSFLLTACGRGEIGSTPSSYWEQMVYFFAQAIKVLSFGDLTGVGIVLFTLLIRTLLLPVFNMQIKTNQKIQGLQPQLRALQAKYPGRDTDSRLKLTEETQSLYKEAGINPFSSLLTIAIQLPVMFALYQALTRVDFLKTGHFLWLNIAQPDPYFVLPVLAALFTFLSTWLTTKASSEKQLALSLMTYMMPIIILFASLQMASGVTLYWTVSNAYQVIQTLLFNNPFKRIAERERQALAAKERERRIKRAKKKAQKHK